MFLLHYFCCLHNHHLVLSSCRGWPQFREHLLSWADFSLWLIAYRHPLTSFLTTLKFGPIPPLSHGWSSPSFILLSPSPTLPPTVPLSVSSSVLRLGSEPGPCCICRQRGQNTRYYQQHLLGWRKPSPPKAVSILRAPWQEIPAALNPKGAVRREVCGSHFGKCKLAWKSCHGTVRMSVGSPQGHPGVVRTLPSLHATPSYSGVRNRIEF